MLLLLRPSMGKVCRINHSRHCVRAKWEGSLAGVMGGKAIAILGRAGDGIGKSRTCEG